MILIVGDDVRALSLASLAITCRFRALELAMSKALRGYGFAALLVLGGCGLESSPDSYHNPKMDADAYAAQRGSIFGADGLNILGGDKGPKQNGGGGIGVNSFLWRASLDTVTFMPLASADPFGGVIITDWYSPPETPLERFKVNIFILDRELRSDGLRAAVFHQHRGPNGDWVDSPVDPTTQTDLENTILTRARQLRVSTTAQN
jgi:hypothetical protein